MLSQRSTMAWADALPVPSSVIISALISRSAWNTRFAFMVLLPPSDPEPEVAPPLLVAFTEFSSPTAAARKRPFRAGAAIFLCALAGTASRLLLQGALGLPLTLAALLAAAAMIAILRSLGMYVPPAGALAILPMLLPAERLPRYPLQIALGTALFLALAITVFREREEAISR